jgi:hypothetical protein
MVSILGVSYTLDVLAVEEPDTHVVGHELERELQFIQES